MFKLKIFRKTLKYFFFIELLILPVYLFSIYTEYKADLTVIKGREREKLDLYQNIATSTLKNIDSDLLFIANCKILKMVITEQSKENLDFLKESFLNLSRVKRVYDQIRFIDSSGMEVARVNYNNGHPSIVPDSLLQNKQKRYYFKDIFKLDSGEIFISPLDLNIENGKIEQPIKPMLRVATPVYDKNGIKQGIILFNYLAKNMLNDIKFISKTNFNYSLFQNSFSKDISFTRKIKSIPLLLNKSGDFIIGEESKDEWNFMLKHGISIHKKYPEAWKSISKHQYGQIKTKEGLFTFSTIYPLKENHISSTGSALPFQESLGEVSSSNYYWKISSFIKNDELNIILKSIFHSSLIIIPIMSFIILIISFILSKTQIQKKEAQSQIKILNGLLPICATCKKIRDDNGYWEKLENYISNHSNVDFSHGICPDCLKKHYPDISINSEKK